MVVQAGPRKVFVSVVCVGIDIYSVYIYIQSADPNPFRGTFGSKK